MRLHGVSAFIRLAAFCGHTYGAKGRQPRWPEEVQVNAMTQKIKEHACPACKGTGFPVVKQPVLATRKIYPAKCEACDGKGRITDAD
jgi:DnaJ-class molecular chaperone